VKDSTTTRPPKKQRVVFGDSTANSAAATLTKLNTKTSAFTPKLVGGGSTGKPAYLFAPSASAPDGELWKVTHWHYHPCPTAGAPSFYSDPFHQWCTCAPPKRDYKKVAAAKSGPANALVGAEDTIEWTIQTRNKLVKTLEYRPVASLEPKPTVDEAEIQLRAHFKGQYKVVRTTDKSRRLDCKFPLCDFRMRVMKNNEDNLWHAEHVLDRHQCFDGLSLNSQTTLFQLLKTVESTQAPITMDMLVETLLATKDCQDEDKETLASSVKAFLLYVRAKQSAYRKSRERGYYIVE
jgi:hypothetical protein